MLAVRDAVRRVFQTQLDDAPEDRIVEARQRLNSVYDSFVRRFGPLSSRDNVKAFAGDPDQPLLLSLETYDPETGRAAKTAIFERRTLERYKPVEHVETAAEALAVSLNETGKIDWPRMEQVTGRSNRELQHELDELVYRNPEGGAWETADRYLSGNVRAKLATARSAAALDASLSPQHRSPRSRSAPRPPARRHRGPARLELDSGDRHQRLRRAPAGHHARQRARLPRRGHRHLDPRNRFRCARPTSPTRRPTARRASAPPTLSRTPSTVARPPPMTSARTAAASSTSRRRSPRARSSSRSRTASGNGSGKTPSAPPASRATTTTASTICACAHSTDRI